MSRLSVKSFQRVRKAGLHAGFPSRDLTDTPIQLGFGTCALSAFVSLWGVYSIGISGVPWTSFSTSFVSVLIFFGCYALALRCRRFTVRALKCSSMFSLAFLSAYVVGFSICQGQAHTAQPDVKLIGGGLALMPLVTIVVASCISCAGKGKLPVSDAIKRAYRGVFGCRHPFLLGWLIILASWIPLYLGAFPGNYSLDTIYQTSFLLTGDAISSKHPVLHTLLLAMPMKLSYELTGSYFAGVAVHTFIQIVALSAMFSYVCIGVSRFSEGRGMQVLPLLSLGFFCLYPAHQFYAVTITKDVLFAGLFAVCLFRLTELTSDIDGFMTGKLSRRVSFSALLLLLFLFRNNAVFGFALFAIPFILWAPARHRLGMVAITVLPVACFALIVGPVYSLAGVSKGSAGEMLSVPAAQLSLTHIDKNADLSSAERDFIDRAIPDWRDYNPTIADSVKARIDLPYLRQNPMRTAYHYLAIGVKNPQLYTTAFLRLNVGYWFPSSDWKSADYASDDEYLRLMSPYYWGMKTNDAYPADKYIGIDRMSLVPVIEQIASWVNDERPDRAIPVVPTVFSLGFQFWLWVFLVALAFYCRDSRVIVVAWFVIAYWVTIMFAPVSIFRYGYVFLTSVPILVFLLLTTRSAINEVVNPKHS